MPGHPEFNGQFFNIYSEVRDVSGCYEWCPDNDVAGSISRATQMAKRSLDSMVLTTLFTHELQYISKVSTANWQAILQGVTNNLASYHPSYVTLDYACQYVRATRTSRLLSSGYDPVSGQVTATLSGTADLDTAVYVFVGADSSISSSFGTVPAFSGTVTDTVATLPAGRPVEPVVIIPPASRTNGPGTTATFSVTTSGTEPFGHQWLHNEAPLANGGRISGATTNSLAISNLRLADAGSYTVVVTNDVGAVTSVVAVLTVVEPPSFALPTRLPDGSVGFSFSATPGLDYRLDASTNLVDWAALTNLASPSGTIQFIDLEAVNFSRRFYRAVWVP